MDAKDQKQTRKNFYINLLALVSNVLVGLYYTPYLIHNLGLTVYGILPLALIINSYINLFTSTLTASFGRFYTIELQRHDYPKASQYISTSAYVTVMLIVVLLPGMLWVIDRSESLFSISPEYVRDAQILFLYTIGSFLLSLVTSMLNLTLFAQNRLDLMTWMKIFRFVAKLVFVIVLFEVFGVDLIYIGVASFAIEAILLVVSVYLFMKYKPDEVSLDLRNFNRAAFVSTMVYVGWLLVFNGGDVLLYHTDNMIVSHYFGTKASGAFGAVRELVGYLQSIVAVVGPLFMPLIMKAFAEQRHEDVKDLSISQSFVLGALAAVMAGIVAGLAPQILSVWINPGMVIYSAWLILKVSTLAFYISATLLVAVYKTWNRLRFPALMTILIGVLDIAAIVLCARFVPDENTAVILILVISAMMQVGQGYVLSGWCVSRIYPGTGRRIVMNFVRILGVMTFAFVVAYLASRVVAIDDIVVLALSCVTLFAIVFAIVFWIAYNEKEKKQLLSLIK